MPSIGVILAALLGAGGIGAAIGAWATLRKASAEAEATVGGAWAIVAQRHETEIGTLKTEISVLRGEINIVRTERTDLVLRVAALTTALDRERETSAALRGEVETLKRRVRELEELSQ